MASRAGEQRRAFVDLIERIGHDDGGAGSARVEHRLREREQRFAAAEHRQHLRSRDRARAGRGGARASRRSPRAARAGRSSWDNSRARSPPPCERIDDERGVGCRGSPIDRLIGALARGSASRPRTARAASRTDTAAASASRGFTTRHAMRRRTHDYSDARRAARRHADERDAARAAAARRCDRRRDRGGVSRCSRGVAAHWIARWAGLAAGARAIAPAAPARSRGHDRSPPACGPAAAPRRHRRRTKAVAPATCALLGVFAERDGRGYALFRLRDRARALVAAGRRSRRARGCRRATRRHPHPRRGRRAPHRAARRAAAAAPAPRGTRAAPRRRAPRAERRVRAAGRLQGRRAARSTPSCSRASSPSRRAGARWWRPTRARSPCATTAASSTMLAMKKGDRLTQANGIALTAPDDVVGAVLRPLAAQQPVRVVGIARRAAARVAAAATPGSLSRPASVSCARPGSQCEQVAAARRSSPSRGPAPSGSPPVAHVAVARDDRRHARRVARLDVAQVVADVDASRRRRRRSAAAACSSGAGCGLACGVVSPHTIARGALRERRARRRPASVKRACLLVTMPQAMPRASIASSSASTPSNSVVVVREARARSARGTRRAARRSRRARASRPCRRRAGRARRTRRARASASTGTGAQAARRRARG